MEIKVYKLEFRHFDTVKWLNKTVHLTATSKIQLIRAFLEEMQDSLDNLKDTWKKYEKDIEESILKFPIIHYTYEN